MRLPSAPTTLTPAAFWLWGRVVLAGGFGVLFALVLYLAYYGATTALLGLSAVVVAGGAGAVLFRRPFVNLCVVLGLYIFTADFEPGIQASEVAYGLYYLSYLGVWFGVRLLRRERILHGPEDHAVLLFLVGATLSVGLSVLFGGDLRAVFSEWVALTMLAFYFPVREACARHPKGVRALVFVFVWFGVFVAVRNALEYLGTMRTAEYVYEIADGRVITNDNLLMVVSLVGLVLVLFAERWRPRLVWLGFFLLVFGGLILTLSRGFWVAFVFGAFWLFWLVGTRYKIRLVTFGTVGLVGFLAVGVVFFGDYLQLVLFGLIDRFASIGSAATKDLSLMSRFYESAAVWARIQENPVLGHGMGVSYEWYNIISRVTTARTFNHNGFLSLWYRFGLWGLALVTFAWLRTTWCGIRAFRAGTDPWVRQAGLMSAAALIGFLPVSNTSNPFFLSDGLLLFALLMGTAAGARARAENRP